MFIDFPSPNVSLATWNAELGIPRSHHSYRENSEGKDQMDPRNLMKFQHFMLQDVPGLVMTNIANWKIHHAINGKIHYKWPFSIANC